MSRVSSPPSLLAAVLSGLAPPLATAAAVSLQLAFDVFLQRLDSTALVWGIVIAASCGAAACSLLLQPSTSAWFFSPAHPCFRVLHLHRFRVWTGLVTMYLGLSHVAALAEAAAHKGGGLGVLSAQLWTRSLIVVAAAITMGGLRPYKAG